MPVVIEEVSQNYVEISKMQLFLKVYGNNIESYSFS
jgi:hypothetical protein